MRCACPSYILRHNFESGGGSLSVARLKLHQMSDGIESPSVSGLAISLPLESTGHPGCELNCGGLAIRYLIFLSLSPAPVTQTGSRPLEGRDVWASTYYYRWFVCRKGRDHTNLRQGVAALPPRRLLVPRPTWSYRSAKPNLTQPDHHVMFLPSGPITMLDANVYGSWRGSPHVEQNITRFEQSGSYRTR